MLASTAEDTFSTLLIRKQIDIAAPAAIVWERLLAHIGPESEMPGGQPFPMKIEPWPGGRWFRDLGAGVGHLWGHVQVIKPPTLLEISGPLFMSYPAISHVQYRLSEAAGHTQLKLVHTAMGLIPNEHRDGVGQGWEYELQKIRETAERRSTR